MTVGRPPTDPTATVTCALLRCLAAQVPASDYGAVMLTAAAELPAVAWAAAVSRGFGGSRALVASLVLAAACLLPGIFDSVVHSAGPMQAAGSGDIRGSSSLTGGFQGLRV